MTPGILWIDGVGGYLICRDEAVTLGQAFAEPAPEIALLADVSRRHATIRRDGESYWLEAERNTRVNHSAATRVLLHSGDRVALGETCQLRFSQAEPLSASARLDLVSGHRFAAPVDAILLMAETLVFDRTPQAHVPIPDLVNRVVIYRQGEGMAIRGSGSIQSSGQTSRDRAPLTPGVPTMLEGITLTWEPV